jgi:FlaA1/EpsC-like NDP-sugar epimerase
VIADICDQARMKAIFRAHRPEVVFHAAAHKHVPLMEWNPGEAVKNNVLGTRALADLASQYGVDVFVTISTDKAVNPSSVMGATKRVAEIYAQALSHHSETRFVTVRFGNVLGSAGSVIPIFKQQIARGGPVTVTHPEMRRYFMTIPEACQLVIQAGSMGTGSEIFVLDMGEPVKIIDLARDMITLSGFTPDTEIAIEFTGIRPGEKLFEELCVTEENASKTRHPKIFVGNARSVDLAEARSAIDRLAALAEAADPSAIRAALRSIVPEYSPSGDAHLPNSDVWSWVETEPLQRVSADGR